MIAHVDIENAKTQDVKTLDLNLIEYIEDEKIVLDIKNLTEEEMDMLKLAISKDEETRYTDIEMFFIDDSEYPEFGPDYDFYIEDGLLSGIYIREKIKGKEV